jgi:hypothetical protein
MRLMHEYLRFSYFVVKDASNVDIRLLGGIGPILDCLYPIEGAGEDVETTRAALRTLCNLSINGACARTKRREA